ncbi:MAG: iron-containing alcohol dehydrogenase [Phycisphaerae bacterium]|nr:iron-containing alcohol dehydrogenase [Phycisphaerae bacterium]
METFEFCSVGRIIFGRGAFARLAELTAELGRSTLVITNAGEIGGGGPVDELAGLLDAANLRHAFVRQRGEPQIADVDRALQEARRSECDVVIGLGGGSAMDTAKAVAGLLTNGRAPIDYMEVIGQGRKITKPAAPWIAVPTTAGTGAEVTRNAVLACREKHFKASIRSPHLLARLVVVDPELGVGVRPEITARAGMDALCQLIESCTSNAARPVTDALAMEGISRAAAALPRAFADGTDLDAREDMAAAALLSGITLTNAGLGAVHGFAAPLGANFSVPHGIICAALLPHVMEANVRALRELSADQPVLSRYAAIGRVLTGKADLADPEAIEAGIRHVDALVRDLRIPPLGQFGITQDRIPEMVALAAKSSSMRYNPVKLPNEVLAEALQKAL